MAKNKKEVLKASRKIIDKAAAAGVSIAAMAKVSTRVTQSSHCEVNR
jgi:O-acetyl-ADP-ribose deacetylase (regulator of RNase III)